MDYEERLRKKIKESASNLISICDAVNFFSEEKAKDMSNSEVDCYLAVNKNLCGLLKLMELYDEQFGNTYAKERKRFEGILSGREKGLSSIFKCFLSIRRNVKGIR